MRPRRLRSVLVLAALMAAATSPAMEVPGGLISLPPGPGAQVPCGGTAVVVSDDGLALTLEEALPPLAADPAPPFTVTLPDGSRRPAVIVRRGQATTAVLLRLAGPPALGAVKPLLLADSAALRLGDTVWTAGNAFGTIELNGEPALSRGIVSGRYAIPVDEPPVRGRLGRILSAYRGTVLETDAAVNDGNQGGALLDAAGRLVGLVSLGTARERRLGTAVPIDLVLRDLGLDLPLAKPTPQGDPILAGLVRAAEAAAPAVALVYLERLTGLGNPEAVPRPSRLVEEAPSYERERLQSWWDVYYHQQQMFYTDQPVTALVVDPAAGLLLTAASNLHGDAERGQVLLPGGITIPCTVLATHLPLDLALLKAERSLPLPALTLADAPRLEIGTPVALLGRHRVGGGHTLTRGVISAVNRRDRHAGIAFAQTDAHANYGNLGGAVVDAEGAVVGMLVLLGPHEDRWLSAHEDHGLGAHEDRWLGALNSGVALLVDSATIRQALPSLVAGQSTKRASFVGRDVVIDPRDGKRVITSVKPGSGAAAGAVATEELCVLAPRLLATFVFIDSASGVVVSSDGLILTNYHVIARLPTTRPITVRLADGITRQARVVGIDPVGDLALLGLDGAHDLPYAELAPESALRAGKPVMAIGNPFAFSDLDDQPSVTRGVLGTGRIVRDDYTDAVQSDAPVNPGNSGGPLFATDGRLVGINGQIRTVSGFRVNSGIGLAIAATQLAAFLPQLRAADGGYVHHTAAPRSLELAAGDEGVMVTAPGESPLLIGDRLVRVAGRPAIAPATAQGLFTSLPFTPGATIPVTVVRDRRDLDLAVPVKRLAIPGTPFHGLEVEERNRELVIGGVAPNSPAAQAGITVNEVLTSANGRPLAGKLDFIKAMVLLEIGDQLELTVRNRDGEVRTVRLLLRLKP